MRRLCEVISLIFLVVTAVATRAQVSVAAVTRTSGLYTSAADLPQLKEVNRFLFALESDLAGDVANQGAVQYKDRTSTQELFRELRLSSSASFDAGSGALRGLLGRLDFLVVIDAIDGSSARMRLIDVENGSVRSVQTCHKRFTLLSSSQTPSECVPIMARRIAEVAKPKAAEKIDRQQKEGQAKLDQAAQSVSRASALREERQAADARLAKKAQIAHAEEARQKLAADDAARQDEANRSERARQEAEKQANTTHELLSLKPSWDEACARLTSAQDLWNQTAQHMSANGRSLRPEITSLLRAASGDLETGNLAIQNADPTSLRQATSILKGHLSKLEDYR